MKKVTVVYSPLCEANGAFLGELHEWLDGTYVEIEEIAYNTAISKGIVTPKAKNCFIDVYYDGKLIDTVPLHKQALLAALGIEDCDTNIRDISSTHRSFTDEEIRANQGDIEFIPITKDTYRQEMEMCLKNYPYGNPPLRFHESCVSIKDKVFAEVFETVPIAGVYAKMDKNVIGLIEVFPREIVRKYGYMTGTTGVDEQTLAVACYEVGYGIPRVFMLDELMYHLLLIKDKLSRCFIEGIGIYGWRDGFNPYWVYEKYGFEKVRQIDNNSVEMKKEIR